MTENELISTSINIYEWGSRVYRTSTDSSDWDYIAVVPDDFPKKTDQYEFGNHTYNIEHESEWLYKLETNAVEALECVSLHQWDENLIIKETKQYPFHFHPRVAHSAISERASIAWVKGKKKLTLEKDFDWRGGKKSIWHCIRLYDYGIQVASNCGCVFDFSSCNSFYADIVLNSHGLNGKEEWEYFKKYYQPIVNLWHSKMKEAFAKIELKDS